jgi:hypothetical protein
MSLLTRRVIALRARGRVVLEADRLANSKSGQSTERGLNRALAFARHRVLSLARAFASAFLLPFLRDSEDASFASRPISIEQDRDARVLLIQNLVEREGVPRLDLEEGLLDKLALVREGELQILLSAQPSEQENVSEDSHGGTETNCTMSEPEVRDAALSARHGSTDPRGV